MATQLPAYAVILAGGRGTRFWPLSRRRQAKQFLALASRESLLQQTYQRLRGLFPRNRIFVVTGREQAPLVRRQLRPLPPRNLLVEPVGRNTAAAIALAANHICHAGRGRDALLAIFPADHAIRQQARFRRMVRAALATAVAEDAMVVLGIPPTHPHTGYGYIECGPRARRSRGQDVFTVRRFTEKPDARTAARYLRSRQFYWNSGMFFWRLFAFDALLADYLPRTRRIFTELFASIGSRNYQACLHRLYPRLQNISVDYALAEPAAARGRVRMLPAEIGWTDLGSWAALYDFLVSKCGENVSRGDILVVGAKGNFIWTEKKFTAAVGVDNLVVVATRDALLVTRRERAQEVGKVVEYLERKNRRNLL
ncbi:MAG: mannose-1-phosphate guanylyltransferase [Terriglobia bacterium]